LRTANIIQCIILQKPFTNFIQDSRSISFTRLIYRRATTIYTTIKLQPRISLLSIRPCTSKLPSL